MPLNRRFMLVLLAVLLLPLAAPAPAHAYIDPGTGSFVIQGIIAAVVAAGVTLKMFWGRIVAALTGKRPQADEDDDA